MDLVSTLTDYVLIHYKQKKDQIPKRLQERLVVRGNSLVIKQLSLWQRIQAKFDIGAASKSAVLSKLASVNPDKITYIFSNTWQTSEIAFIFENIAECHDKELIQEILARSEIQQNINMKINGSTPLMLAIKNNNLTAIPLLLEVEGIDLNIYNFETDDTALTLALALHQAPSVKELLKKGCKVPVKAFALAKSVPSMFALFKDASSEQKSKLLVDAVEKHNVTVLKKILNEMHEIDMSPALAVAIRNGNTEILEKLLGHGVDKSEALHVALREWAAGDIALGADVFEVLLAQNRGNLQASLIALSDFGSRSTRSKGEYTQLLKTLEAYDSSLNLQGESCYRALLKASERGNWEFVEALLTAGANVQFEHDGPSKILLKAASRGDSDVVKLLLDKGADVSYQDTRGNTPLKRAELRLQYGHIPGGLEEAEHVLDIIKQQAKKQPS
ncbi:MAG: ankyrin repeat domain-containing protein [Chlamydiales bacterium]|nr:ankyrin repeat domain-containing protein [Chlamydiales bacterium]